MNHYNIMYMYQVLTSSLQFILQNKNNYGFDRLGFLEVFFKYYKFIKIRDFYVIENNFLNRIFSTQNSLQDYFKRQCIK